MGLKFHFMGILGVNPNFSFRDLNRVLNEVSAHMRTSIVDNSPETQPANQSARSADPTADYRHPNLGRSQFVEHVSRSPRRPTLRLRALGSRTRALDFGGGRASGVTVIQNPHPITVVPCLLIRRRRLSLHFVLRH